MTEHNNTPSDAITRDSVAEPYPVPQLRGRLAVREAEIERLTKQLQGAVEGLREIREHLTDPITGRAIEGAWAARATIDETLVRLGAPPLGKP